ncbi:MAG: neutral/alkaline non-lysosomal ceramidase N-terminal domain-containing protein, partial [Planctomycetes bacterium]|nr:neutral/alkaline non-lysosomal ceramidase N-terminal domain-containing protein [Planctomycetota bacterium]
MHALRISSAVVLLFLAGCASIPAGDSPLSVGAATADITPPVGWRRAGGFSELISTGVHDPLYAKALVIDQGGERAAIVVCDLCSVGRETSDLVRRRAGERTGIPLSHIAVTATHTHGGPEYFGVLWETWRDSTIEKHGKDIHALSDYPARLVDGCVDAIVRADAAKRPVTMDWGMPQVKGVAFNRRYHMKDGVVQTNPGKMNRNIERAAGPVDEDFPILLFRESGSGLPVASLSAFAVHVAVYGGGPFSAYFPAVLQDQLREKLGNGFVSVFAAGTAGDTNHVDVGSERPQPWETETPRIGAA